MEKGYVVEMLSQVEMVEMVFKGESLILYQMVNMVLNLSFLIKIYHKIQNYLVMKMSFIQHMKPVTFIIIIRKISHCLRKWE